MKNAIEILRENGLVVSRRKNNQPAIIGGTESTECGGITIYKNSFSISYQHNNWIIYLPGKGQMVVTKRASTLEEAAKIVCNYLAQRGLQTHPLGFRSPNKVVAIN